jgi:glycine cleavage system regulatory protein
MSTLNTHRGFSDTPNANRRYAVRHKALKAVKLVALDAWVFVDGILRDISETGAKIECKNCAMVQDEFRLLIVVDGTIQPCKIIWRRLNTMGVEFTGPMRAAPPRKF